jgi:hypothetical protein
MLAVFPFREQLKLAGFVVVGVNAPIGCCVTPTHEVLFEKCVESFDKVRWILAVNGLAGIR